MTSCLRLCVHAPVKRAAIDFMNNTGIAMCGCKRLTVIHPRRSHQTHRQHVLDHWHSGTEISSSMDELIDAVEVLRCIMQESILGLCSVHLNALP